MSTKEKILILFHGEHIAYSPTTIQLYDELAKKYDVTLTAEYPKRFNNQKLENRNVLYHRLYKVKTRYFYWLLFQIVSVFNSEAKYFKQNKINYKQYFFRFLFIKKLVAENNYKAIISIDTMNALFCSILKIPTDFLSLELCADEQYIPLINTKYIRSVLIQSEERLEYLFKTTPIKTYFVQNAPNYVELEVKQNRKGLVYGGSAYDELGFYHCLNFLNEFPNEKLTIQGAILKEDKETVASKYQHLLDEKRLIINQGYLENDAVVPFLSDYEIGFCFYNFEHPTIITNYFNFATAPSGKMFKYLAAGVPVVCSNIIGFKFVNDFQCGILVENLEPVAIENAINLIRNNYQFYVENAIKAAKHYSFDKAIQPYLKMVEEIKN